MIAYRNLLDTFLMYFIKYSKIMQKINCKIVLL